MGTVHQTEQTRTDSEFEAAGRVLKFWCPQQNVDQAIDNKSWKYHGLHATVQQYSYRSLVTVVVVNEAMVKVKVTLEQAMKAQRESRGIGLLFL
jgi:hypothetical protein